MQAPDDPGARFARGLRIYGAFFVVAGLVWLVAPMLALMVLGFGSLAGAEHIYRVYVHFAERPWRLRSVAALVVMAAVFLLVGAFIALGRGR